MQVWEMNENLHAPAPDAQLQPLLSPVSADGSLQLPLQGYDDFALELQLLDERTQAQLLLYSPFASLFAGHTLPPPPPPAPPPPQLPAGFTGDSSSHVITQSTTSDTNSSSNSNSGSSDSSEELKRQCRSNPLLAKLMAEYGVTLPA